MARKLATIEKEIESLKDELKEARKREREENKAMVLRAFKKSGLEKMELPRDVIEREFANIAARMKDDEPEDSSVYSESYTGTSGHGV